MSCTYEERFNEYLDEINSIIVINGMEYLPSRVLNEVDSIAYGCEFSNWLDSEGLTEKFESGLDIDEEEEEEEE